jgi:hypothetical protein
MKTHFEKILNKEKELFERYSLFKESCENLYDFPLFSNQHFLSLFGASIAFNKFNSEYPFFSFKLNFLRKNFSVIELHNINWYNSLP